MGELREFYTVREAAEATGFSVPYFYTKPAKANFGYDPEARPWLIPGALLVSAGLLDSSGRAVSDKNAEARSWKHQISDLRQQLDTQAAQIAQLESELSQRDAQIEVLKELLTSIGKN